MINSKVGDTVLRDMCGVKMVLEVSVVEGDVVSCGPWTFHRITGGEIDEDLGWDGITLYGSFIVD